MKSINKLFIILTAVTLAACFEDPGTDIVWGDEAYLEIDRAGQPNPNINSIFTKLSDGTTYPLNVQVNLMGRPRTSATTVQFEIASTSTAVEGVHYNKLTAGNSITIPAGSNTATIQFEIIADAINPSEVWPLTVTITGGDVPLSKYVSATFRLQVACPSDLGGTYSYSTTNIVAGAGGNAAACGGTVTGTGTLTESATTNGVYTISDASFGQFACAWGDTPPGGTLRLNDLCNVLSFTGADKYGDNYTISVVSVTATTLVFDWTNTYNDGGRTTLTRTDAKTWPLQLRD